MKLKITFSADSAIPAVKVHPNEISKSRYLTGQENEKQSQC